MIESALGVWWNLGKMLMSLAFKCVETLICQNAENIDDMHYIDLRIRMKEVASFVIRKLSAVPCMVYLFDS